MFNESSRRDFDLILLVSALLIFAIGLAFLHSASYQRYTTAQEYWQKSLVAKQILRFIIAVIVGAVILKIGHQKFIEFAYLLYGLNILLLLLVLVLGETRLGAQRWISLGFVGFQPSEFSKIIMVFTLARYLGQKENSPGRDLFWHGSFNYGGVLVSTFLLVGIPFILIMKQPDLGTALILVPILIGMLYVWGMSLRTLAMISLPAILASPFLWHMLKPYQQRRILVFINPNADPLGAGYTIIQSKIAIGSGGLFGKGWLAGTQNQLNFLPERHTDFIFSIVGEEWGFLGAALLLILYIVLISRAFSIAQRTLYSSSRLLACGIIVMLVFQVIINIAMTMGLVPVVGLPLPLISYGGTSLFMTVISLAFLLSIGMRRSFF